MCTSSPSTQANTQNNERGSLEQFYEHRVVNLTRSCDGLSAAAERGVVADGPYPSLRHSSSEVLQIPHRHVFVEPRNFQVRYIRTLVLPTIEPRRYTVLQAKRPSSKNHGDVNHVTFRCDPIIPIVMVEFTRVGVTDQTRSIIQQRLVFSNLAI
jgi:hypothetical protein